MNTTPPILLLESSETRTMRRVREFIADFKAENPGAGIFSSAPAERRLPNSPTLDDYIMGADPGLLARDVVYVACIGRPRNRCGKTWMALKTREQTPASPLP